MGSGVSKFDLGGAMIEKFSLPNNWHTLVCTRENLALVWKKLNEFPILFDDSVRGDYEFFLSEYFDHNSIILLTGDYGVCRFNNIIPERECEIHLAFWDRRFKGRLEECQEALRWIFNILKLHRASISVPSIAHSTITFIRALGFKPEGRRRDSWRVEGRYLDVLEFGILDSEVFEQEELTREVAKDGEQERQVDYSNEIRISE